MCSKMAYEDYFESFAIPKVYSIYNFYLSLILLLATAKAIPLPMQKVPSDPRILGPTLSGFFAISIH